MARTKKNGLDSFPLDVDIFSDEKVMPVTAEYGCKGQIVIIHLLCAIYRNGYFVLWDDKMRLKLAKSMPGVSVDLLDDVVARLVKWQFFDRQLFISVSILTSAAIQRRYFSLVRRRKIDPNPPYLCISIQATPREKKTPPLPAPKPPQFHLSIPDPIVGSKANEECLQRFFNLENRPHIEALCIKFGLSPESEYKLRQWADRIITDWNISEKSHSDYTDWAGHLIRAMWSERSKDDQPSDNSFTTPAANDYAFGGGFGGQDI